jgi:hypothetical protein
MVRFDTYSFGALSIDGVTYDYDVLIDRGSISKRQKKKSKPFRDAYGHTPLSAEEAIPGRAVASSWAPAPPERCRSWTR